MSYDIELADPTTGRVVEFGTRHQLRGGTCAVGGTPFAELNITYNYAPHFRRVLGENGIRTIYGMTGQDSLPLIEAAIAKLGDDVDGDYWKPTEGNAKAALRNVAALARMYPHGVRRGSCPRSLSTKS